MIVDFSNDLSVQRIFAEGDEVSAVFGVRRQRSINSSGELEALVCTFANPRLVTDSYRILNQEPVLRDSLVTLLASHKRTARFSKTRHDLDKSRHPLVWAPSIDTFFLCSALRSIDLDAAKTAVEIGCGSGFVGKYLLEKLSLDAVIDLVDNDTASIACAREAVKCERISYHILDATDYLAKHNCDLVVANPPYLPRPDGGEDPPFGGTRLMDFLVGNVLDFLPQGGRLVLVQSSISSGHMESMLPKIGVGIRPLRKLRVPLKVVSVLNDQSWMDFLESAAGVRRELQGGYDLSHELVAYEIMKL